MGFEFEWYDDDKTVMHYIASGNWNWRDYHHCVRASSFSMHQHPHTVHTLIDLRGSERDRLPGGVAAHMRSFGKRTTPVLSGDAVVIGFPDDARDQLPLNDDGTMDTQDGTLYFADDDADLQRLLAHLRETHADD